MSDLIIKHDNSAIVKLQAAGHLLHAGKAKEAAKALREWADMTGCKEVRMSAPAWRLFISIDRVSKAFEKARQASEKAFEKARQASEKAFKKAKADEIADASQICEKEELAKQKAFRGALPRYNILKSRPGKNDLLPDHRLSPSYIAKHRSQGGVYPQEITEGLRTIDKLAGRLPSERKFEVNTLAPDLERRKEQREAIVAKEGPGVEERQRAVLQELENQGISVSYVMERHGTD